MPTPPAPPCAICVAAGAANALSFGANEATQDPAAAGKESSSPPGSEWNSCPSSVARPIPNEGGYAGYRKSHTRANSSETSKPILGGLPHPPPAPTASFLLFPAPPAAHRLSTSPCPRTQVPG